MQDEVSGITPEGSGGEGWAGEGSPIKQMSPGWLPPLGDRVEERAKGQGQDKGPLQRLFSLPLCYGMQRVCMTHQLLLNTVTGTLVNMLVSWKARIVL